MKNQKVVMAMSGGVDSSVAAFLLKDQGYDVIGVFMRFWSPDEVPGKPLCSFENLCCSAEAKGAAERTANQLKIPFHVLDLRDFFKESIVQYFIDEYLSGRTPNPCVLCGQKIKFGQLFQKAVFLFEADYLATGHYVKVKEDKGVCRLLKGEDQKKDQSYFLYTANQEVLKRFIFPLADLEKTKVRKIAEKNNLPSSTRKESQEICFVPFGDYKEFLKSQVDESKFKKGKITDKYGNVLGKHNGLAFYTIGQRKGMGIAAKEPLYVIDLNIEKNELIVGEEKDLYNKELLATNLSWVSGTAPKEGSSLMAKIRYGSKEELAKIYFKDDKTKIVFEKPQRAITPGQSIVFYKKDEVLGGGIIEKNF